MAGHTEIATPAVLAEGPVGVREVPALTLQEIMVGLVVVQGEAPEALLLLFLVGR